MQSFTRAAALSAAVSLTLMACGPDEVPAPRGMPTGQAIIPPSGQTAAHNERPVVERVVLRPSSPRPGDVLSAEAHASDPDGDKLTLDYVWRMNGRTVGDGSAQLRLGQERKGSLIEVSVVAKDGFESSQPGKASVRIGNQPPMMLGVVFEPRGEIRADRDLVAEARAADPDEDEMEYTYRWWVNGQAMDGDGPRLSASAFNRGDRIELAVTASDGMAESEELHTDPITVTNSPPQITSTPGPIGADGRFRYAIVASDPDGDRSFGYRLVKGPDGMAVDPVDGVVSWSPTPAHAGHHAVEVQVDDRRGGQATQAFRLELRYTDDVPAAPQR